MILIVTSKDDLTADYLILRLIEKGIDYFRLNTEDVPSKVNGCVNFPEAIFSIKDDFGRRAATGDISAIWYRRPKMLSSCESIKNELVPYVKEDSWFFVNGLLELTNSSVIWVSPPHNIRRAENKLFQLKLAAELGLRIPKTIIGNSHEELRNLFDKLKAEDKSAVIKPIRSGRFFLKSETLFFHTSPLAETDWEESDIREWPVIIQENISKKRDIRVTIFGNKVFSIDINTDGQSDDVKLDWRRGIKDVKYEHGDIPDKIKKSLLEMLARMGLSFGALDLIETPEGEFVFLEVNPNGQWAWLEDKTGMPMRDALIETLSGG